MATKIELIICVVSLILATTVNSFKLLVINNVDENDILTKLSQVLHESKRDSSAETKNHIAVRGSRKNVDAYFQRKKLIKTILPRGQEVRYKTHGDAIYKPLVRFHQKKPILIKDDEYKGEAPSIARSQKALDDFAVKTFHIAKKEFKKVEKWFQKVFKIKRSDQKESKEHLRERTYLDNYNSKTKDSEYVAKHDSADSREFIYSQNPYVTNTYKNKQADVATIWEAMKALKFKYNEIDPKEVKDDTYSVNKNKLAEVAKIWEDMKALKLKHNQRNPKVIDRRSRKSMETFANRIFHSKLVSNGVHSLWNVVKNALPNVENQEQYKPIKTKPRTIRVPTFDLKLNLGDTDFRRLRSGEEYDPLAPGKLPFNIELHEDTTKNPTQWEPSYPFWNYWTYDKTLHQDKCGEGFVRFKDKCIGSPPH